MQDARMQLALGDVTRAEHMTCGERNVVNMVKEYLCTQGPYSPFLKIHLHPWLCEPTGTWQRGYYCPMWNSYC